MKMIWLLLCIAVAGCGAKSDEDIAKELVTEKMKTSPDYSNYESVNFGTLGSAFLPYEETEGYISNMKVVKAAKDSVALLEQLIAKSSSAPGNDGYKKRIQQLLDTAMAVTERNNAAKQAYTPGKLFKITHAYKLKDQSGAGKVTEHEFYFDTALTKVVKVHKVY